MLICAVRQCSEFRACVAASMGQRPEAQQNHTQAYRTKQRSNRAQQNHTHAYRTKQRPNRPQQNHTQEYRTKQRSNSPAEPYTGLQNQVEVKQTPAEPLTGQIEPNRPNGRRQAKRNLT